MTPGLGILLFAAFAALVVGGGVLAHLAQKRRREALLAFALERGWSFWRGRDRGFERRFPHFECLRRGKNRHAELRMEGMSGERAVVAFDYHYEQSSGTGKDRRTTHHYFSGLLLDSGLALEPLTIRCENILDRVGAFFGLGDIDFELAEFNRAFHVRAPRRRWAVDVIQPPTMELLLASPRFQTQLGGRHVLVWRERRFEPADFAQALALAEGLLERLPPSLVLERTLRR